MIVSENISLVFWKKLSFHKGLIKSTDLWQFPNVTEFCRLYFECVVQYKQSVVLISFKFDILYKG